VAVVRPGPFAEHR